MDEGELLEMANTLKTKFEALEIREKMLEIQMLEFTKSLCGIYGLIRLLDNLVDDRIDIVDLLINELRSDISNLLFRQIDSN